HLVQSACPPQRCGRTEPSSCLDVKSEAQRPWIPRECSRARQSTQRDTPCQPCYRPAMFGEMPEGFRRVGLLAALLGAVAVSACSRSEVKTGGTATGSDPVPARPSFTVFAVAEMRGQIGPCGCTTDPLGDISRTTELVARARAAGPVLFLDAGSLLYSRAPVPAALAAQEEMKADLLAATYQGALKADA